MDLRQNWRPLMMVWFAFLLGLHWVGLTPDTLSQETINHVMNIIQLGIGSYIIGRSAEKTMQLYKDKDTD